jgi:hypothetical protein
MAAEFYSLDKNFLGMTRIINEVKGVNCVIHDITSRAGTNGYSCRERGRRAGKMLATHPRRKS